MKRKIIKAQNISITKCTNSLVLLVLNGECSVLKFNKIKNYQKQDVIFIEKEVYKAGRFREKGNPNPVSQFKIYLIFYI